MALGLREFGTVGETYGAFGDHYAATFGYFPTAGPDGICDTDAYTFEFQPVDASNDQTGDPLLVDRDHPPTLRWDLYANHPRTLTGMRVDSEQALDLDLSQRLRLFHVDHDGTRTSLGHFIFTAAPKVTQGGLILRVCALADLSLLLDAPLAEAVSFPAGTKVSTAIRDLVNQRDWPLGMTVTTAPATFAQAVGYRAGANLGQAIGNLCTQAGLLPPQWDRDGVGTISPAPSLDEALTPDHDLDASGTVSASGYADTDTLLDEPNRFQATASTPSSGEVSGFWDLPASAPNSIANRGGVIVSQQVDAPGASTSAACVLAARTAALSYPGATRTVELDTDADFTADINQVARFDGLLWRQTAWACQLSAGAEMSRTLERPYKD